MGFINKKTNYPSQHREILLIIILVFLIPLLVGCGPKETPAPTLTPKPKEVEVFKDQAYLSDGLEEHLLDIYLPAGKDGPFPTLLMIHGGNGKKEDLAYWGQTFVKKGFAAVSIDHRQWPDHSYPAHLEDAFCALSWLHANAENYQFDTGNIFVMGHSAGGTLAAMLGVVKDPTPFTGNCPHNLPEKDWVQGVIPFTGLFDYGAAADESPALANYITELLGGSREEVPDIWLEASAASWINGSEPPFLLIHGEQDQSIPPAQSQAFAEILVNAGVDVKLLIIPGASHNQIKGSSQSIQSVEEFLLKWIR